MPSTSSISSDVYSMAEIKQQVNQKTIDSFQQFYSNASMIGLCSLKKQQVFGFNQPVFKRKNDTICEK
jgi:hypothetical protein